MPLSQEEITSWLAKHATASTHLLEVVERWRGWRGLDPKARALHHQDHQAVVKEFEQFGIAQRFAKKRPQSLQAL
jgi:hypothetical protein